MWAGLFVAGYLVMWTAAGLIAYTHAGSRARAINARTLHVELLPGDVLVLRLR